MTAPQHGSPEAHDMTVLGRTTWHCSDEDGGPDCGITLGLGSGRSLYVGEISQDTHANGGPEAAALGSDNGWWLVLHPERTPLARFTSDEAARDFMDRAEELGRAAAQADTLRARLAALEAENARLRQVPDDAAEAAARAMWEVYIASPLASKDPFKLPLEDLRDLATSDWAASKAAQDVLDTISNDARAALAAAAPAIRAEVQSQALAVLKGYEQWEADLVLCSEAWNTANGLPQLTQALYDRLMELQAQRNRALAAQPQPEALSGGER